MAILRDRPFSNIDMDFIPKQSDPAMTATIARCLPKPETPRINQRRRKPIVFEEIGLNAAVYHSAGEMGAEPVERPAAPARGIVNGQAVTLTKRVLTYKAGAFPFGDWRKPGVRKARPPREKGKLYD
jgi:hypothetical protein